MFRWKLGCNSLTIVSKFIKSLHFFLQKAYRLLEVRLDFKQFRPWVDVHEHNWRFSACREQRESLLYVILHYVVGETSTFNFTKDEQLQKHYLQGDLK